MKRLFFPLFLCCALALGAVNAWADPTKDATTCGSPSYDATGVTFTTGSITVASHSDRVMVGLFTGRNVPSGGDGYGIQTSGGVTFNGSSTGWSRVVAVKPVAGNGFMFAEIWKLDAPTVTTATVTVTANSTGTPVNLGGCVTAIYDAHQGGPDTIGTFDPQADGTDWDISPTFTTTRDASAIFDVLAANAGGVVMTAESGRVESFNLTGSEGVGQAGSEVIVQATAGAYNLPWTTASVKGVQVAASWAGPSAATNAVCVVGGGFIC